MNFYPNFWVILPSLCNLLFPALLKKLLQLKNSTTFTDFFLFRGQKLLLIFCVPLCDIWENNTSYLTLPIQLFCFVFFTKKGKKTLKNQNNFGLFLCAQHCKILHHFDFRSAPSVRIIRFLKRKKIEDIIFWDL